MFRFDPDLKVYLHRDAIDFRVGLNGLAIVVEQALGMDPFAQAVYVFRNKRRDRIKILGWQRNGFWLLMKRLEQDRFIWPGARLAEPSRRTCSSTRLKHSRRPMRARQRMPTKKAPHRLPAINARSAAGNHWTLRCRARSSATSCQNTSACAPTMVMRS